ncbi:MAG: AbrB/MazE/SpoVT family DNA-binding domain-containing protein [Candidatus Verstraetearchaeota archaeon]|nr:AbrB/MazE/SpoVT family DNA-binding domain-containing protein [Candidatus Verstraetearchaeota archaeon]
MVVLLGETAVRVDEKGRLVIPSKIRRAAGVKKVMTVRVERGSIVLTPVADPLESLGKVVVKGTKDVEVEIRRLRRVAQRELSKQ